jgi:hypothetical protein
MEHEQRTEKSEANGENYERNDPFGKLKLVPLKIGERFQVPAKMGTCIV